MIISLVLFFEVTLSVGLFFFYLYFAVDKVASDVNLIPKVGCVITILWHFMGLLADLCKLLRYIYFLFWLSVFCRSNEIQVEIPQNSENKPQGLYFLKALFEGLIFGGAYNIWRVLSTEGNLHFKIDWASLIVARKFAVFALFYSVFEGNFQGKYKRPGEHIFGGAI